MAEKTYDVVSPIKHGGKRIEIGGTVDMDEDLAKPFLGKELSEAVTVLTAPPALTKEPEAPPAAPAQAPATTETPTVTPAAPAAIETTPAAPAAKPKAATKPAKVKGA